MAVFFDIKREVRVFDSGFSEDLFALAGLKVNGVSSSAPGKPTGGNFDG